MSPTPEELQLGGKAYRLVKNYEKNGAQSFRPQIGMLVIISGLFAVSYILVPDTSHHFHDYSELAVIVMPIAVVGLVRQYWTGRESYAQSKLLLQLLKEKYGETLPWLIEEQELASVRELEAAIAKDRSASHA